MTMLKHSWIKQFNMDEISTVSKKVKDIEREIENGVHSATINLSLFDSGIEAGVNKRESQTETEEPTVATFYLNNENGKETPSPILRNLNAVRKYSFTRSILKKNHSEPYVPGKQNGVYFQNKAFEGDDVTSSKRRQSFADVVTQFIAEPIKEDSHPFGRGHLYKSVLDYDQPKIHRGEESVLMWVLAILLILGIAVGVIIMSQMHILRQKYLGDIGGTANQTSISQ
ncbi:uncharacterized protein LOC127857869 [Dreissena polymorpha]|uniref:Uncharacterized protein n=1 Tax=Dreissena polymorpha TaxID=45954 RepID=A0A9D4BVV5_DREPO|nr:uncharacterized protein LOC127857869 [Dreissena polymorpha]XP_052250539.1 uncharacterized protein LOC127857869 [Dreissena polymorpha]XP_052250540.1 uncharacterized protein LOC127857869 [Dreissena polymorpha]KAH3711274.1 hypothetical protein DPMN_070778 [Dreissena polymorpha]